MRTLWLKKHSTTEISEDTKDDIGTGLDNKVQAEDWLMEQKSIKSVSFGAKLTDIATLYK